MKAILIDSENRTVSEKEIEDWRGIAPSIGCELFDIVRLDNGNGVYVDDEGLMKDPQHFFVLKGYPNPLAGNGLVLGTNPEGESVSTTLTVEKVKAMVKFYNVSQIRAMIMLRSMRNQT